MGRKDTLTCEDLTNPKSVLVICGSLCIIFVVISLILIIVFGALAGVSKKQELENIGIDCQIFNSTKILYSSGRGTSTATFERCYYYVSYLNYSRILTYEWTYCGREFRNGTCNKTLYLIIRLL